MKALWVVSSVVSLQLFAFCGQARAVTYGYAEEFASNDAGWRGRTTSQILDHLTTGGVADSGYVSHPATASADSPAGSLVANPNPMAAQGLIIFRAGTGASGGAFTGNWLTSGISRVQAYLDHSFAPQDMEYYVRLSRAPGQAAVFFGDRLVDADSGLTLINFEISPDNFSPAGFADYPTVLSLVTEFQIGALLRDPVSISDQGTDVDFSLDHVSLVPEPSSGLLALGALAAAAAVRRRRSR
jgi:MYXO-CTERM domain-containing protein